MWRGFPFLGLVGTVVLPEKVTCEIRLGNKEARHADIWRKYTINRRKLGACLICLGNSKEASVTGAVGCGGNMEMETGSVW